MLFSVIVAHYENASYLPDLVRSMQAQTYTDWELIIVDDHSREDPLPWLECFLSDQRIIFKRHSKHLGAASAFRTATEYSKGELIGMLGADDALVPQALERMVQVHLANPSASMANSACYRCDESLQIVEIYRHYRPLLPGEALIRNMCIGSFAVFKRVCYDQTEGFDAFFRRALDHDIYLKLDEVGKLVYVEEPLYLYRTNIKGISQFSNGMLAAQYSLLARYNAFQRRLGTSKENLTPSEAKQILKTWYLREMLQARMAGDANRVQSLSWKGFCRIPSIIFARDFWSHLSHSFFHRGGIKLH